MKEDKNLIIQSLHDYLKQSWQYQNLEKAEYVKNNNGWFGEEAVFTFNDGKVERVNISGDNCLGILLDVLKHFGHIRRDADLV